MFDCHMMRYLACAESLFKCNLSNIYAAFYTISTDSVLAVPCVSAASCMNRETTDKRILYARNTKVDNNKILN